MLNTEENWRKKLALRMKDDGYNCNDVMSEKINYRIVICGFSYHEISVGETF